MSKFKIISIKKAFYIIFSSYGHYSYKVETKRFLENVEKELLMGAMPSHSSCRPIATTKTSILL